MFGSQNKVEKFNKDRREARQEMTKTGRQDQRKRNKTQRGNDRWDQQEEN